MADNIDVTPGSGRTIATDQIAGVDYPRGKVGFGVDGSYVDASASNPLPVTALSATISGALPAGSNTLGAVSLVGTSAISGTITANAGSGTFAVSAASLPLPTGASTETTLSSLNGKVTACDTAHVTISGALPAGSATIGAVTVSGTPSVSLSGTSAVNVSQVGGSGISLGQAVAGSSIPVVLPSAQITTLTPPTTVTIGGSLPAGSNTIGTVAVSSLPALTSGSNTIGAVNAVQSGTWTVQPGNTANTTAWLVSPQAATAGGASISKTISAASTNGTNVKGSAGLLYAILVSNVNAAVRYLKLYDKATTPTVGTDTPVLTMLVPPSNGGFVIQFPVGITFSNGIGFGLTTGVADNDTGAVSASEHVVNLIYK